MDKSTATAFGTVNLKANVLSDVARPGSSGGQKTPAGGGDPLGVGSSQPGGMVGQGTAPSGGQPLLLGETRPGGVNGQGTGSR
jgi:hypothetical protein